VKLNLNTGRGAAAALISPIRRSPRYLGEYDKSDDEGMATMRQHTKEDDTIMTTARGAKETSRHKKSKSTLRKLK
jgi:hypothetical protein